MYQLTGLYFLVFFSLFICKIVFNNNLIKIGYFKRNQKEIKNSKFIKSVIKAFQRRFRQELINGKIDRECLIISKNLSKKFN